MAKIPYAIEYAKKLLEEEKCILIFGHHTLPLETMEQELKAAGISVRLVSGKTSSKNRTKAEDDFQNGEVQVLLGQIQAAGEALTLVRARRVFFLEGSYVPGQNRQVIARLRRYGQAAQVIAEFLVYKGSLGAMVLETALRKQDNLDEIQNRKVST